MKKTRKSEQKRRLKNNEKNNKDESGKDIVDQENANKLIDYALAHGVNYYDTSPVGLFEKFSSVNILFHIHGICRDRFF